VLNENQSPSKSLGKARMMAVGQEFRQFLSRQYTKMGPVLNEKVKRLWAGATALELGYGGSESFAERKDPIGPESQQPVLVRKH